MCNYRNGDKCQITMNKCPWVYYCGKIQAYKERDGMNRYCKYRENENIPDGYSKVSFERRGYLYVEIDNQTVKIQNPYDYVPKYVKIYNTKSGYRIKKEKKENED